MKRLVSVFALVAALLGQAFGQKTAAFADKPALITAIGQSADFEMIKVLMTRSGIPFVADSLVKAESLDGKSRTLLLVVGASSKGLGAAGISADAELARARALLARAKELGLSIITLHVGGTARRGALSDGFIEPCMAASDYAIVVEAGDQDGFFTKLAEKGGIALAKVARISAAGVPLTAAFK
ncbi:MAG: DUF6305 family protein [Spirochaetaceae bacterium]|nr:DUF6305 family protein [Spirochaetaceae bacterium]